METNSIKPLPVGLKTETLVTSYFDKEAFGVVGINVCDVLSHLFPDYWDMSKWATRSYEADRAAVLEWCDAHGAHYYARGREDFSLTEAREEAVSMGLARVVYEDLS
jgi:hypothetical protein